MINSWDVGTNLQSFQRECALVVLKDSKMQHAPIEQGINECLWTYREYHSVVIIDQQFVVSVVVVVIIDQQFVVSVVVIVIIDQQFVVSFVVIVIIDQQFVVSVVVGLLQGKIFPTQHNLLFLVSSGV